MKHFIVGTAGHVDHGKSTLVRALTGTDPDRLPEEKRRGITIDLGFAHLALGDLELGIVDVPGHEDFIKNMAAGVGSVDAALFVVAADDGWMPQTEEHLQILTYLGVTRAVVALTKIDLAADEATSIGQVRARLAGSPFADAPVVPTAVLAGRGLPELREALRIVLADAPTPRDVGKPRLPVDRVFTLRGVGTVVTGTLTGGTLSKGQSVAVYPAGRAAHARSVQHHGREADTAVPGTRTALNLPELAADGDGAPMRGDVVTLPGLGKSSLVLDVLLTRSGRPGEDRRPGAARNLEDGKQVRIHLGSGSWNARVSLVERGELPPGTRSLARLRCDGPVCAFAGDRFIVRDGAGRRTVAGGVVLDPDAARHRRFRRGPQRRLLERVQALWADTDEPTAQDRLCAHILATLERDGAERREELLRAWPFSATEIGAAVTRLAAEGKLVATDEAVADAARWHALLRKAAARVDAEHRTHPERIGLPTLKLWTGLDTIFQVVGLGGALTAALTGRGEFVQVGASVRRASHRPKLPGPLQAAGEQLRAALAAKPFEPPSRRELASDGPSRQALRFLFDTGEAVELGAEVVLLEENYRRMRTIILRTLRTAGPSTASDLRLVLGTTRRVLIPVLERLDREGSTRREGDRRVLR